MSIKFTINEIIANPELMNHDDCWSFYDWFCSDKSLEKRAKAMIPKLKFLVKAGIINGDTCSVWFKNNCPINGSLYDDMRFTRILDSQFVGGICTKTGHKNQTETAYYWTFDDKYALDEYKFKDWTEMKNFFKKREGDYIYE